MLQSYFIADGLVVLATLNLFALVAGLLIWMSKLMVTVFDLFRLIFLILGIQTMIMTLHWPH